MSNDRQSPEQIAEQRIQIQLKLRLRPAQERLLNRWLWRLAGAWNWALRKIEADSAFGLSYSAFDVKQLVVSHGAKAGVGQHTLEGVVADALNAWQRHRSGLTGRPRLKGRRRRLNSIPFTHGKDIEIKGDRVYLRCVGLVRFHRQQIPSGHVGCGRVVRRSSGWYLCLFIRAKPQSPTAADGAVGIDPGFHRLLTLSTGEVVDHPGELREDEVRLAQVQRGRSRRLAARIQERQANRRRDRNHKLSRRIVAENSLICWSKDSTLRIAKAFGKSVRSAGHGQLRSMLAYKSRNGGRRFIEVSSRNSTRTCSACGALTGPTGWSGLKVRAWRCACGAEHDRDVNAARNTLKFGLGISHESGPRGCVRNRLGCKTARFIAPYGKPSAPSASRPAHSRERRGAERRNKG